MAGMRSRARAALRTRGSALPAPRVSARRSLPWSRLHRWLSAAERDGCERDVSTAGYGRAVTDERTVTADSAEDERRRGAIEDELRRPPVGGERDVQLADPVRAGQAMVRGQPGPRPPVTSGMTPTPDGASEISPSIACTAGESPRRVAAARLARSISPGAVPGDPRGRPPGTVPGCSGALPLGWRNAGGPGVLAPARRPCPGTEGG
jgi:hypothetical protein